MEKLLRITLASKLSGRIRLNTNYVFDRFERSALIYKLEKLKFVKRVYIYKYTGSILIECLEDKEEEVIEKTSHISFNNLHETDMPPSLIEPEDSKEIYEIFRDQALKFLFFKVLMPMPFRPILTVIRSIPFIKKGFNSLINRNLNVELLDATAIGISIIDRDFKSASTIMTLLNIGEELEDYTLKKTRKDLEQSLALNIDKVWILDGNEHRQVPLKNIDIGDKVIVNMGNVIPIDGRVWQGDGMVNQSSLTGESVPVRKIEEDSVYAGSVLEEGSLIVEVIKGNKNTKLYEIINLISESEKLKAEEQLKAENMADSLVKFSFIGALATLLLTKNYLKAKAFLMVDYSCALKLTAPIAVMTAMRESSNNGILVKGGKYLELLSKADTIVFDKTGTLTEAKPELVDIITFNGYSKKEALRIAACLEEHFPHSVANAVVERAIKEKVSHRELHTKPEYIVSHGIASTIDGKRVLIGSEHFIVEDEGVEIPDEINRKLVEIKENYSVLYLSIDRKLIALLLIKDPVKADAKDTVRNLRELGIKKIVMLTGDSENAASSVANELGMDYYQSQVLPKDKSDFIKREKELGNITVMVGDGINDSVALSNADVGIAMTSGADIAKEIADITISSNELNHLVNTIMLSRKLEKRLKNNYRNIIFINTLLIILGVTQRVSNTTSALAHNASTVYVAFDNMKKYL